MKRFLFIIITVMTAAALLLLPGCQTDAQPEEDPAQIKTFSEVYNDGVTVIETGRLVRLPGSSDAYEYCCLELRLTNNGTAPIYYSSMLCLSASSGGNAFPTENILAATLAAREAIDGFLTLDGVIDPDTTVQGFVLFEAPAGTESFDIRLATDFCDDEWVGFSCGVS